MSDKVFVEEWSAQYGPPYLLDEDEESSAEVELIEDGEAIAVHDGNAAAAGGTLAFIDGVRRAEAALYRSDDERALWRGIAGAFAVGAVRCDGVTTPTIVAPRVERLVIWEGDDAPGLPVQPGGWNWTPCIARSRGVDGPLAELQNRMRAAEARLADELVHAGHFVVTDGPLYYTQDAVFELAGYVKTHRAPVLPPEHRVRVPQIRVGQRTSLFRMADRKYACYARMGGGGPDAGPWSGIVRLEFPLLESFARVVALADALCIRLVAYAGIPHRDPRAPQNLQPIGGLETHLRHLLGSSRLALRAVREAVAAVSATENAA